MCKKFFSVGGCDKAPHSSEYRMWTDGQWSENIAALRIRKQTVHIPHTSTVNKNIMWIHCKFKIFNNNLSSLSKQECH